jgi:Zn-finger nucleic acid-binding protein
MIVVEHGRIELDYCPNCSGVWFDSGELELVLEQAGREGSGMLPANILSSLEVKSLEKRRRCPICNQKMKKATMGKEPGVLTDVCPKGEGLWFDGGELTELLAQCAQKPGAGSESQKRVLTFLEDTFKAAGKPANAK